MDEALDQYTIQSSTSSDPKHYVKFVDWRGGMLLLNRQGFIEPLHLVQDAEWKPHRPPTLTEEDKRAKRSPTVRTLIQPWQTWLRGRR